jgi:elongation factor P
MATIQATRLKKGMLVKMAQDLFRVLELQHVTPGNLRGFVRVKLRNIRNGTLSDQKLRSEDSVERATLDEREMQYLYQDGDDYYFMDTRTYEQTFLGDAVLGDSKNFLKESINASVLFYNGKAIGLSLPNSVDLRVIKCDPGVRGDTVSGAMKPATLETGYTVMVPLFINEGDVLKIDTRDGKYLTRVATG